MDIDTLIEQAEGVVWGSALRCDFNGYVPPLAQDWLYGDPPVDYLRSGEQPHFTGIAEDRVLKFRVEEKEELEKLSRIEFSRIQEGLMYDGWTGYLSSDSAYCSILLVTDQRVMIFVGQEGGDQVVEFPFEDPNFTAISPGLVIHADGYEYKLHAFSSVFRNTTIQTVVDIFGPEVEVNSPHHQQSNERSQQDKNTAAEATREGRPAVSVPDLLSLTPTSFEEYVADVWRAEGYECELTPRSADDGIDILADGESHRVLIQAKRYSTQSIGIEPVQRMAGLLVDNEYQADEVVIATTSSFTKSARRRARNIDNLLLMTGDEVVKRGNDAGLHLETEDGDPIYETEVSRDEILDLLGPDPLRTVEVQNALETNAKPLVQKLKELEDEGKVKGKHIGNGHYIWYLPTQ
ncbi:restriction endonuclease [Haloferax massiliensis]|uniref:Restriction endonuclease n=1 Tax=Haloferax massiliensis TaxID=1476858 RepID=A0A0D6JMA9_9EURY|nr:restriction endonuclease [Haloferax massiliensis]CQR49026.1 Restriction endonuclease [Haloferax massiliensis]